MFAIQGPKERELAVGWWLVVVALFVVGMILVGGATRLTDSGLSITEWSLAKGLIPPLNAEQWAEEFALYKQTAEYQFQNAGMSLSEFQFIYWWEWGHRFLGKTVGLVFGLPFFVFWAMGRLKGRFWSILGLFALGGLQGYIGWWMVESGLAGRLDVAPYRLATHLGVAFLILGVAAWLAADCFGWPRQASSLGRPRALIWGFVGALYLQILLGALVAGNRAGKSYTDWPTLGGEWFPSTYLQKSPVLQNFFENHATVQFNHRMLGYIVGFMAILVIWQALAKARGAARGMALCLGALVLVQIVLGIGTLMMGAPLGMGLVHQGVAILIWAWALLTARASWR
jgi:cytochrome c oxidase assembly protein subunit 15